MTARPLGGRAAGLACLLTAAVLELALRMTPSYDPYGWLVWGRQTIHLALDPSGAPSWKPLPWLLTTPLALAGGAAPDLWLIVACAGGLATLVLAYRLAARLAGPVAGVVAVLAILTCRDWFTLLLTGNVEPAAAALGLAALDAHLSARSRRAFVLLCLAALMRPECFLVLGVYGLWLLRADRGSWRLLTGAGVVLPALWFVPPLLATGVRFNQADPVFHVDTASHDPLTVIHRGATIVTWPVASAAVLALVLAAWRDRAHRETVLWLVAGAVGWTAGTAAMSLAGFPGLQRFMLPPAAAGCVLAGAGTGWTAAAAIRALRSRSRAQASLGVAAALAATALAVYYTAFRVDDAVVSIRGERHRASLDRSLSRAIASAGGVHQVLACGRPTADLGFQSTLGWDLGLAVGKVGYRPARDVRRRRAMVLFASGSLVRLGAGGQPLAHAGPWRVIALRPAAGCRGRVSLPASAGRQLLT